MTGGLDSRGRAPGASAPAGRSGGGAGLLALAVALAPLAAAAEPAAVSSPGGLTVAILDLDAAPALSPQTVEAPRPAWRTSFGSERVTRREADPDAARAPLAALAHADAVLIQGVKAASPLRRLFPPRAWRLIVSRRLAVAEDRFMHRAELPAATAIALRARPGLRVTARAHALRHADAAASPHAALLPPAATAVRIVERGRTLWLASVTLPSSCHKSGAPCPAREGLDAWREARRKSGEATLIGGRLTPPAPAETDETEPEAALCTAHGIESDLASEPLPPGDGSGCISLVRLGN